MLTIFTAKPTTKASIILMPIVLRMLVACLFLYLFTPKENSYLGNKNLLILIEGDKNGKKPTIKCTKVIMYCVGLGKTMFCRAV